MVRGRRREAAAGRRGGGLRRATIRSVPSSYTISCSRETANEPRGYPLSYPNESVRVYASQAGLVREGASANGASPLSEAAEAATREAREASAGAYEGARGARERKSREGEELDDVEQREEEEGLLQQIGEEEGLGRDPRSGA